VTRTRPAAAATECRRPAGRGARLAGSLQARRDSEINGGKGHAQPPPWRPSTAGRRHPPSGQPDSESESRTGRQASQHRTSRTSTSKFKLTRKARAAAAATGRVAGYY
jgi:hypothetical protein